MPDEATPLDNDHIDTGRPISWWSWRPGIKPRNAALIGGSVTCIGLLLAGIGLTTFILGIMDSFSAPIRLSGVVATHSLGIIDRVPRLAIRLREPGFPREVAPVVPNTAFRALHDGDPVMVSFSPRLHFLYLLEGAGQRYALPEASAAGNPPGSVVLLLLGLLFLPYPALLTLWGLRDLRQGPGRLTARVIGLRVVERNHTRRAGLTPHLNRSSWYGVALQPLHGESTRPITFSISQETYAALREGEIVTITYTPNVHYIYAMERER